MPSRSAKITISDVSRLRELYNSGRTQGSLAREFGLSIGQVGRIVRGEAWQTAEVEPPEPALSPEIEASLQKLRDELDSQPFEPEPEPTKSPFVDSHPPKTKYY